MTAVSISAPIGGWNATAALDKMPATDAVKLVNWVPRAGYCQTRGGSTLHVSGLGGPVQSIISYRGANDILLAAGGG